MDPTVPQATGWDAFLIPLRENHATLEREGLVGTDFGERNMEDEVADELLLRKAVRCGSFIVGSDIAPRHIKPFWVSLKVYQSFPRDLTKLALLTAAKIMEAGIKHDLLAPASESAVNLVTLISVLTNKPMVTPRFAADPNKHDGEIEGDYSVGQRILLIEDTLVSGLGSIAKIKKIRKHGLLCDDMFVVVNGSPLRHGLLRMGETVRLHQIYNLSDLFRRWQDKDLLPLSSIRKARDYIEENNIA